MVLLNIVFVAVALVLLAMACSTLRWMMHAWHRPESYDSIGYVPDDLLPGTPLSFSLIVPCRDETLAVMGETIRRLLDQDHRLVRS